MTEVSKRACPRDGSFLKKTTIGQATVDVCGKCEGTFFDSGDMLVAFGVDADPATWDRPETGGTVKESALRCPRCHVAMHAQDVKHDDKAVEVDRCGKCRGVWLDKNEIDTIVAIGHALEPLVAAERAKAREELAKLGDDNAAQTAFESPLRKRSVQVAIAVVLCAIVGLIYIVTRPAPRARRLPDTNQNQEGGCPCGCDRSAAMAAALRIQRGKEARTQLEMSLETIADRENVGYVTERMIQHRLRLLELAAELNRDNGGGDDDTLKAHGADSVDGLLGALDAAHTYEERQPLRRTLYASGRVGLVHLATIDRQQKPTHAKIRNTIAARLAREEAAPSTQHDTLRVSAELLVHGTRFEIVDAQQKLITSSFRLWLKLENLTNESRTIAPPTLYVANDNRVKLPMTRWYEEDGDGQPWDGALPPNATMFVNVIGDIPEQVKPGTKIDAVIELESLKIKTTTHAQRDIHLIKP